MTNCIADRSQVKNVIRNQQRKLGEEMKMIVKQKATQSRYPALSRSEKRVTEFHHDRLTQEQSLQKDCKKAERLARRIAQILERLRKEFNKIKDHLGNYNFTSTIGMDSSCGGACADDLSTDIGTRQAWKRELANLLTMVWHYVDAQHLGDFALNHQPEHPHEYDPTCNSSGSNAQKNCCPKVFRPTFHYYTPDGDCLAMPSDAGSHSGNANMVSSDTVSYNLDGTENTNNKNYNGSKRVRSPCVLGYKTGTFAPGASDSTQEYKGEPTTLKSFQITNKDLEIRQLWRLIAAPSGSTEQSAAWLNFLIANAYNYAKYIDSEWSSKSNAQKGDALKEHFRDDLCLPLSMIKSLSTIIEFNEADNTILATLDENRTILREIAINVDQLIVNPTNVPLTAEGLVAFFPTNSYWVGGIETNPWFSEFTGLKFNEDTLQVEFIDGTFPGVLTTVPNICNIEDEADCQFIFKVVTCMMNRIRGCQLQNDREQQVIEFVNEVAECNEAFHQDVFTDMTAIDESELCQRYAVGKELCADLDGLYKENCCTKQNFFNDVTLTNMCW